MGPCPACAYARDMNASRAEPALAVDPSRSTPDAVTPPAVFPEAAPPRATTPEPMTDERLSVLRSRFGGYRVQWAPEVTELLAEVDRLRAPRSPSRESGALLDEHHTAMARLAVEANRKLREMDELVDAYMEKAERAERDAARWRAIRPMLGVDGDYADGGEGWSPHVQFLVCDEEKLSAIAEVGHTWTVEQLVDRAALSPSGEPTATPET
jgi:hypothetical protein